MFLLYVNVRLHTRHYEFFWSISLLIDTRCAEPQKLIVAVLDETFQDLYMTLKFITVFTGIGSVERILSYVTPAHIPMSLSPLQVRLTIPRSIKWVLSLQVFLSKIRISHNSNAWYCHEFKVGLLYFHMRLQTVVTCFTLFKHTHQISATMKVTLNLPTRFKPCRNIYRDTLI